MSIVHAVIADIIGFTDSEVTKNMQAIVPDTISISPTGHVLLTLDTRRHAGPGGGGKDVVAWGANSPAQLADAGLIIGPACEPGCFASATNLSRTQ